MDHNNYLWSAKFQASDVNSPYPRAQTLLFALHKSHKIFRTLDEYYFASFFVEITIVKYVIILMLRKKNNVHLMTLTHYYNIR